MKEGQHVQIAMDSPSSKFREGWISRINLEQNVAVIDFRDGSGLADIINLSHLKLTNAKENFDGHEYLPMKLPYGQNKREIRDSFIRSTGGTSNCIYDSDYSGDNLPNIIEIGSILEHMQKEEVLIVLGSNVFSIENELLSFAVLTVAGWHELTNARKIYIKVLKRVRWSTIQHQVITKP